MIVRAYIGGTFDLFHPGHVNLLKTAKNAFGYVIVGLNRDEFVERFKRLPIMTYDERFVVLKACKYVDEVVENTGDEDSKPAILASSAQAIVHGDDWTGESLMKQMGFTQEWLDENKITLHYLPYTSTVSGSQIRARVAGYPIEGWTK